MKHVLHHDRDFNMGTVDVYLDIAPAEFSLSPDQLAVAKQACAAKAAVGMVTRSFGGSTMFRHGRSLSAGEELQIVMTVLAALGQPQPANLEVSGGAWNHR